MNRKEVIGRLVAADWPRVLHVASVFLRELRGDDVVSDDQLARSTAQKALGAVRQAGRQAVGCKAPAPCSCAFCKEETTT